MDEQKAILKYTVNCISCLPPDDTEEQRIIYEDVMCKVVLRTDNQCWLGRYIVVPRLHLDPVQFWDNVPVQACIMKMHVQMTKAVTKAFGACCVQQAQLGGLTMDENGNPTFDQKYQHAYIHGIPRYSTPVQFAGKEWKDPQFIDGKFSALNIDPKNGLQIIIPTREEISMIVVKIRSCFIPPQ